MLVRVPEDHGFVHLYRPQNFLLDFHLFAYAFLAKKSDKEEAKRNVRREKAEVGVKFCPWVQTSKITPTLGLLLENIDMLLLAHLGGTHSTLKTTCTHNTVELAPSAASR